MKGLGAHRPGLFSRLGLFAVKGLFKELSRLRLAIEAGVDSYRTVNNLAPLFGEVEPAAEPLAREFQTSSSIKTGDYLTMHLLEETFREQRIPFDHETDLEGLAKEIGILSPEGKFLIMPQSADLQLSVEDRGRLMGE